MVSWVAVIGKLCMSNKNCHCVDLFRTVEYATARTAPRTSHEAVKIMFCLL